MIAREQRIEMSDASTHTLFELVEAELRRIATRMMSHERGDHTLSATALVNEAYVRLHGSDREQLWDSKGHFFSAACEAMRRILIDHARSKATNKRSCVRELVDLNEIDQQSDLQWRDHIELDDLIEHLHERDPQAAKFVKLRLFTGLSIVDAGEVLGLTKWSSYQMSDFVQNRFAINSK